MPQRIEQIKHWLKTELQADIHSFEPASNDASFRRYFRVVFNNSIAEQAAGQAFIVMDAPPEKEAIAPFIDIAAHLEVTGVHVPHIYAVNEASGFILMFDLGNIAYLSLLNSESGRERADKLYADAMSSLLVMQRGMQSDIQKQTIELADYDAARLKSEMDLLPDWYIKVHCQQTLTDREQTVLDDAMKRLVESAQEQPQVFVHRDYHSRNLMFYAEHNPGVIDFQDAVIGPVTYDLVSLLRDSYIAWPDDKVYEWVEQYRQMLLTEELLQEDNKQQFVRWFDWMGIQRQLKVVGIFCRLNYRDGKSHYLNDIPQTLDYLFQVCARYPEFESLLQLLTRLDNDKAVTLLNNTR
ncbi:MAG: phosphotransferase [gamma proteobacterium symbiont of Bathyaustriella thionipta]|nr:phosphotransferase [gamma proteobacterium symbiont of Bathyaustriella thionipta]MCU7949347.1 phosphotransferase [gamma proteobacterium symbiont of Bathyaustriella thionipta]MCU7952651.1 phosphotransferase [gamma proteobacterium symbiont of Bathyaustriella thionipta]MCU7955528.1 phosphotransferase [gamma proteobacterium symbiont of Bathyaustriella thionipta]MCU7968580.1 phosphotransferase [gamma proteobacterium symbiont of Bathyaustriella thionipta]